MSDDLATHISRLPILICIILIGCFDDLPADPLCFDRRDELQSNAETVINFIEDSDSSSEAKVNAIDEFEQNLYTQTIEERDLSCVQSSEIADHCRQVFPILYDPSLGTLLQPSYYRVPWLYLIDQQAVSEVVTACDLAGLTPSTCLHSQDCDENQRCVAVSDQIPEREQE